LTKRTFGEVNPVTQYTDSDNAYALFREVIGRNVLLTRFTGMV
jgi:hypothetical protein